MAKRTPTPSGKVSSAVVSDLAGDVSFHRRTSFPPKVPELSEMEFRMILAWHAFSRWMMRCMAPPASVT